MIDACKNYLLYSRHIIKQASYMNHVSNKAMKLKYTSAQGYGVQVCDATRLHSSNAVGYIKNNRLKCFTQPGNSF